MNVGNDSGVIFSTWLNLAKTSVARSLLDAGGSDSQLLSVFNALDTLPNPGNSNRQVLALDELVQAPAALRKNTTFVSSEHFWDDYCGLAHDAESFNEGEDQFRFSACTSGDDARGVVWPASRISRYLPPMPIGAPPLAPCGNSENNAGLDVVAVASPIESSLQGIEETSSHLRSQLRNLVVNSALQYPNWLSRRTLNRNSHTRRYLQRWRRSSSEMINFK